MVRCTKGLSAEQQKESLERNQTRWKGRRNDKCARPFALEVTDWNGKREATDQGL